MTSDLIVLRPEDKLLAVKEIFETHKIHHIPIVKFKSIIGMVSKSDFLSFSNGFNKGSDQLIENIRYRNWKVSEIMTTKLAKLEPEDPIRTAIDIFKMNYFHALPVCKGEELVGIVTTQDIIAKLAEEEINLTDYQMIN